MTTFRSFEYLDDKGKVNERAWANLRTISDEICRANGLSVIENPEQSKGKSHYEWDMYRQGLSWKAKLKFAIDQVIKQSENFEDFLQKCRESRIEIDYNPKHKIDLKFRMKGQQKWSRAKTLGWYYETKQIKRKIEMYRGIVGRTQHSAHADRGFVSENKNGSYLPEVQADYGRIESPHRTEKEKIFRISC